MQLAALGLDVARAAGAAAGLRARSVDARRSGVAACAASPRAGGRLVALWAQRRARPRPRLRRPRRATRRRRARAGSSTRCPTPTRAIPTSSAIFPARGPHAARGVRSGRRRAPRPTTSGRGCGMAAGRSTSFRCAATSTRSPKWRAAARTTTPFVQRRGRRRARDPGRPGARGHHRARAFPLLGRRREGAAARGAPRLHAQGHREALRAMSLARRRIGSPGASPATRTVAYAWAYCAGARSRRRLRGRRRARAWLRALLLERERVANHLGDLGASATTPASRSAWRSSRASARTGCAQSTRRSATAC